MVDWHCVGCLCSVFNWFFNPLLANATTYVGCLSGVNEAMSRHIPFFSLQVVVCVSISWSFVGGLVLCGLPVFCFKTDLLNPLLVNATTSAGCLSNVKKPVSRCIPFFSLQIIARLSISCSFAGGLLIGKRSFSLDDACVMWKEASVLCGLPVFCFQLIC